jgi:hypothetical protein
MNKFIDIWKKYAPVLATQLKKGLGSDYLFLEISDSSNRYLGRLALEVNKKKF